MAYNPADGYLYGISAKSRLVRINKVTGETLELGKAALNTGTLACDDKGTFYALCSDDNALYSFTLDTLDKPVSLGSKTFDKPDDWTGEITAAA